MIGKTLGHYEILGSLGKGGMGEVFRARDTKLGREVALKILPREIAGDPDRVARFRREALAVAAPGTAPIASGFCHPSEQALGEVLRSTESHAFHPQRPPRVSS